jgi:protein SCO1
VNGPGSALDYHDLPAVNALLNGTATVLLLVGYTLIKCRREAAHKAVMLTAFVVSMLFLTCYLVYHYQLKAHTGSGGVPFTGQGPVRYLYYTILLTHVVLAATVPVLALLTIYWGLKDRRAKHRRLARVTFPIWLYVSVTGVVIYGMLYHLYPSPPARATMGARAASHLLPDAGP